MDGDDLSKRDLGTAFHRCMDGYLSNNGTGPVPEAMVKQVEHAKKYIDQVLGPRCDTIHSEVAIGVNWVTGEAEIQEDVKDRQYVRKLGWQYGTADLVCILKTGELLIADWKTGGNDGAEEQLLSLACAFQRTMTGNDGDLCGWYRPTRTLCLQVNEEGVWPHEKDWSQDQLQSHWDSMRFKWEDVVSGNTGTPKPGIHCTTLYCPHLAYCSAIQDAVLGLGTADEEGGKLVSQNDLLKRFRVTDSPESDEEAGFTMAIISAAKRQQKYVELSMKEYIKNGGSVVQGGYVWSDGGNGYRWRKQ